MTNKAASCPGYLVWNPDRYLPTHVHTTLRSARDEATRLASNNPSETFYVLAAVEARIAVPVKYETRSRQVIQNTGIFVKPVDDDEIPF